MSFVEMQSLPNDSYNPFAVGFDDLDLGTILGLDGTHFESPLMSDYLPSLSLSSQSPQFSPGHSPASTESEQSLALDPLAQADFDFESIGLDLAGIERAAESLDHFSPLPFAQQDSLTINPASFFDLGQTVASALSAIEMAVPAVPLADNAFDLAAYAALLQGHDSAPPVSAPPSMVSTPAAPTPTSALKRKLSDTSSDVPAPKRRGRPSKASQEQSLKQDKSASPRPRKGRAGNVTPRMTASGKLSTERPRACVTEKGFKSGAEQILGMTRAEILSFPDYETLLLAVSPERYEAAVELGRVMDAARGSQRDAAEKTREERKQKLLDLETKVDQLEGKLVDVRAFLQGLVDQGIVPAASAGAYLA